VRGHALAFPTQLAAWLLGRPLILEINGPYEDMFLAWPWTRRLAAPLIRIARSGLRWADAIIAVTPQLATWIEGQVGRQDVVVIENGANTVLFRPDATGEHSLSEPYVVFCGAMTVWQGINTLLDAVQDDGWPEGVRLVIVGDGTERSVVETVAARCKRIVYLGRQPYAAIPSILAGCIAAIVPKNNLGDRSATGLSPLKVYEAMACGVPVVVTDLPGMAQLVRDEGAGLVVPTDDPKALARAVAEIHGNPELGRRLGARGRMGILARHSWETRAIATSAVIHRVMGSESGSAKAAGDGRSFGGDSFRDASSDRSRNGLNCR
jgi:glycosyltransferase involved in cell wall biosynthesis